MTTTVDILYSGAPTTWTVPPGVTEIQIIAAGGGGGGDVGGFGGVVTSTLSVLPGDSLDINIGGGGAYFGFGVGGEGGGYNGGGATYQYGFGGGGMTTVIINGITQIVAGGGGGGSSNVSFFGGNGLGGNGAPPPFGGQGGDGLGAGGAGGTGDISTGVNGQSYLAGGAGGAGGVENPLDQLPGAGGGAGYGGGGGGGVGSTDVEYIYGSGGGGGSFSIDPNATFSVTNIPNGQNGSVTINYMVDPAISSICFPAGTPIKTDQGLISIEKLDLKKHTIDNKPIKHITKTITQDKYLICFEKNALGHKMPSDRTVMSKDHMLLINGRYIPASQFLKLSEKVKKIAYTGEILYNVLLENYGTMQVNNLICETLHPDNIIAKLYNKQMSEDERATFIVLLNNSILKKDYPAYKKIVKRLL